MTSRTLISIASAAVLALPVGQAAATSEDASPTRASASCGARAATMVVTAGSSHVVHGTSGRDVIVVRHPGHVIRAGGGDDMVCGSRGRDRVHGGPGDDHVYGGRGDDHLYGGPGRDVVVGGHGRDVCEGGRGDDDVDHHGDDHPGDDHHPDNDHHEQDDD